MKNFFAVARAQAASGARLWLRRVGIGGLAAVLIAACGGGGDTASVGSGGTGAFSVGNITGFGSVIVSGLRYEDAGASVSDEDGARNLGDLRLGMVVTVQGSVGANGSATASSIAFDSELLGPVQAGSVDAGSRTFIVLGQKVRVGAGTNFDASLPLGLAGLGAPQVVNVHGFLNPAANELQATFIELKTNPDRYKISGYVSGLQGGARTFRIGAETIAYTGLGASDIPPGLANGVLARVRLVAGAPDAAGARQATRLRSTGEAALPDRQRAELEGVITVFTSATQFTVGAVRVDASGATFDGTTAGLGVGSRVEVKGTLSGGTLVARLVKQDSGGGNSGSGGSGGEGSARKIELEGPLSALDTAAQTFVLRGVTVSYAGNVRFDRGSRAQLRNGAVVEVEGRLSSSGTVVEAARIKFEDQ